MSSTAMERTIIAPGLDASVLARVVEEGYGPGAWHGADLREALADVSTRTAFWRPGTGRHNIAEIALHHASCVRAVVGRLSGRDQQPFVLEGEDWYEVSDERTLGWPAIQIEVEKQQQRLRRVVADIAAGKLSSPLDERERLDVVLGATCHAVYHAGQVQLIKVLAAAHERVKSA